MGCRLYCCVGAAMAAALPAMGPVWAQTGASLLLPSAIAYDAAGNVYFAATSAELNGPQGVAVGGNGTVYIADTGNQRVRAVIAGTISTFAGNGVRGFAGDGGVAAAA